jgi:hypothetical protein
MKISTTTSATVVDGGGEPVAQVVVHAGRFSAEAAYVRGDVAAALDEAADRLLNAITPAVGAFTRSAGTAPHVTPGVVDRDLDEPTFIVTRRELDDLANRAAYLASHNLDGDTTNETRIAQRQLAAEEAVREWIAAERA